MVDPRDRDQITHSLADIIRFRLLMISAGYEDSNDANSLRSDPVFKMALDLSPSDRELCSQSTISRLENLPDVRALLRMTSSSLAPSLRQSRTLHTLTGGPKSGVHMWTAPSWQGCLGSARQCSDQIACVHMSGLLSRSHMNAGQDGFRDASSKHFSDLWRPLDPTECLASWIDRSHHLLVTLQVLASALRCQPHPRYH